MSNVGDIRKMYQKASTIEGCQQVVEEQKAQIGILLVVIDEYLAEISQLKAQAQVTKPARRRAVKLPRNTRLLTWDDVNQMRSKWLRGVRVGAIATFYGLSYSWVSMIVHNKRWEDPDYDPTLRERVAE